MKPLLFAAALCAAVPAHAVYKCTSGDKVVFQQLPCPTAAQQTVVAVRTPAPSAPPALTVEQRMVAASARDKRIKDLEYSISVLETQVYNRTVAMDEEVSRLKEQSGLARNNLAGATYAQGKAVEMQAVVQKYTALNAADQEQLKVLRVDLEATRRGR